MLFQTKFDLDGWAYYAGMLTRTSLRIQGQGQGLGLYYQGQGQGHELHGQGQGQGHCFLKDFSRTFAESKFYHSLHCFV